MTINPEIQALIEQLNNTDSAARIAAADALGQFAASNADVRGLIEYGVPALVAMMRDDPIREGRWAAAYALGALGDASAIPALEAAYQKAADDTGLRLVIVKAMGKTQHIDAMARLQDKMLHAESLCIRKAAEKALMRIGDAAQQGPAE